MELAPIDEVEEEEAEESSSESEAEVLPPTVELRRSTRTSRCKRSFKEDSDEDCDEVSMLRQIMLGSSVRHTDQSHKHHW